MGGLRPGGLRFEFGGTPKHPNPFRFQGPQESKLPGPKPPINHR